MRVQWTTGKRMDLRCRLLVSICVVFAACQREVPAPAFDPSTAKPVAQPPAELPQAPKTIEIDHPRFKVFKTQNIVTLLLLDTRTGQLWQVQYSINEKKSARAIVPISTDVLADGDQDGRFNLTMTDNIWTSILVDTKDGRLWQCQFGAQDEARFCIPIEPPKE